MHAATPTTDSCFFSIIPFYFFSVCPTATELDAKDEPTEFPKPIAPTIIVIYSPALSGRAS